MKSYIKFLFTLLLLSFFSCDDKEPALEELNLAPTFEYFSRANSSWNNIFLNDIVIDSAKVWTIENNLNYAAVLRASDINNNFGNLQINASDNNLNFFIDNDLYMNDATVALDSFAIVVKSQVASMRTFNILITDTWNKTFRNSFEIHYVNNRTPRADLELIALNQSAINEYEINATQSVDRDSHLGGFITEYEYTIDGVVVTIPLNKINHVFNSGDHIIKLRVKDNDGVWSTQITRNININ